MDGRVLELSAEVFIASQSDVKCQDHNAVVLCGCYESEIARIFFNPSAEDDVKIPRNFVHRNYHDTTFFFLQINLVNC